MNNVYRLDDSRLTSHALKEHMPPKKGIDTVAQEWRRSPTDNVAQQKLLNFWERHYLKYFTPGHWFVLSYVHNQTIDLGVLSWGFTKSTLANGFKDRKTGEQVTEGTGYSKRHIQRGIKYLEEIGAIYVERSQDGLKITPIANWKPYDGMPLASERRKKPRKSGSALVSTLHALETGDTDASGNGDTDVSTLETRLSPQKGETAKGDNHKGETVANAANAASAVVVSGFLFKKETVPQERPEPGSSRQNLPPPQPRQPPPPKSTRCE